MLETTEESEIFEIRAYRRNPQFRLDQGPTVPRVYMVESRQVEEVFGDDDDWDEEDEEYEGSDKIGEDEIDFPDPDERPS